MVFTIPKKVPNSTYITPECADFGTIGYCNEKFFSFCFWSFAGIYTLIPAFGVIYMFCFVVDQLICRFGRSSQKSEIKSGLLYSNKIGFNSFIY